MPRKFQGSSESRFGNSEKDRYFLKIPKWQDKLIWIYKPNSYFLNNPAKTRLFGLKISENIEIKDLFQPKSFQ